MIAQPTPVEAARELSLYQAGHVARWQLARLGLDLKAADRLAARRGWASVMPGVWQVSDCGGGPDELMWAAVLAAASLQHRGAAQPVRATVAEVHGAACAAYGVTGQSAAWLLDLLPQAPDRPQLLLPHAARCRLPQTTVIRTRLPIGSLQMTAGIPAVSALRVLWDLGQILHRSSGDVGELLHAAVMADARRLVKVADLHHVVRNPRSYGLPSIVPRPLRITAFTLAGGHSHSASEAMARATVTEVASSLGLWVERRPLAIPDEHAPVAEADIAIPRIRLDIEIDGPHHLDPAQQRHDRWRDRELTKLGWTVRRYPSWLVHEDPERFRRLVEADIRSAAAAAGVTLRAAAA